MRPPNRPIDTLGHLQASGMGFFGNIWVRKMLMERAGECHGGHKHDHDHISLLISGKVLVEVAGFKPTTFTAPTYIIIKAEHEHKITALEDNTQWWCVFAMRDENGEVVEHYTDDNSPYQLEED